MDNLDQLLYFAFQRTSDNTIAAWARDEDKELEAETVDRVRYIRDNMPELAELWEAKSDSIIPPLVAAALETTTVREGQKKLVNQPGRPEGTEASSLAAYGERQRHSAAKDELVLQLKNHLGRWVAIRGIDVIVDGRNPAEVIGFLRQHNLRADSIFRVPRNAAYDSSGER